MANSFSWSWTTKAGPKAGQTFSVPTIPISCKKDDHKAIHWTVFLFHSFKTHLHPEAMNPETGRVLPSFVRIYQNNMLLHFRSQIWLKTPQPTSKDPSPPQPPSSHPTPSHANTDNAGFDACHEIAELWAEIAELRSQLRSITQPHEAFSSPTSPITAPMMLPPPHQSSPTSSISTTHSQTAAPNLPWLQEVLDNPRCPTFLHIIDSGMKIILHNTMLENVQQTALILQPKSIPLYLGFDSNGGLIASTQSDYDTVIISLSVSSPTKLPKSSVIKAWRRKPYPQRSNSLPPFFSDTIHYWMKRKIRVCRQHVNTVWPATLHPHTYHFFLHPTHWRSGYMSTVIT